MKNNGAFHFQKFQVSHFDGKKSKNPRNTGCNVVGRPGHKVALWHDSVSEKLWFSSVSVETEHFSKSLHFWKRAASSGSLRKKNLCFYFEGVRSVLLLSVLLSDSSGRMK